MKPRYLPICSTLELTTLREYLSAALKGLQYALENADKVPEMEGKTEEEIEHMKYQIISSYRTLQDLYNRTIYPEDITAAETQKDETTLGYNLSNFLDDTTPEA